MSWPWDALGLPGPAELSAVRRAYARQLKRTRPDENPEGFQRLRNAYQAASRLARGESDGATNEARREADGATNEARREADGGAWENGRAVREETWDFERLFAEGEADERGRRFQKLWELRLENQSRYDAWKPPPPRRLAEAAPYWAAISRALSLMEELAESGADDALWRSFCKSQLFLCVRRRPDFVFALEDFLRKSPEIPQAACDALFHAYGFDAPTVAPECGPLRELLQARIPEAVWTRPPITWRSLFGLSAALLIAFALNFCADFLAAEEIRAEQVRRWLHEDFGREFVRVERRPASPFAWLDAETETYFLAAWDGPRDAQQGRKGYASNYAEARMAREIAAFADRWHYALSPAYGNAPRADWSALYLQIPLTGAGEGILALGDALSAMKDEDWRKRSPPDCRLFIGWGNWSFCEYDAQTGEFNASALRDYYERFFGADLCRIVLRGAGVARADMGKGFLLTPESGAVRVENREFFQVTGIKNPGGRPLRRYFLSADGAELFCVPADREVSELTLQEFYSMDKNECAVKGFSQPLTVFHETPDR